MTAYPTGQPQTLVDPDDYDVAVYNLLHSVTDRIIELASKADHFDDDDDDEGDSPQAAAEVLRAQMAMPPSERTELKYANTMLNVLLATAIVRRSALYEEEDV